MSLKVADWKAVLNQPKNLGMKAFGGTGMGKALENYQGAEEELAKGAMTPSTGSDVKRTLKVLIQTCDATIQKHGKVYTTACEYLKNVKKLAEDRLGTVTRELTEVQEVDRLKRSREGEKESLKDVCAKARGNVTGARDMNQLNTVWKGFQERLQHITPDFPNHFPKLKPALDKAKVFKKQPTGNAGIGDVKPEYLALVKQVDEALGR